MIGVGLMLGAIFLAVTGAIIWAWVLFWLALVFLVIYLFQESGR